MICYDEGKSRFNYRVGGISINGDRILLEKDSNYDFYVVPGGRCELQESAEECLKREVREEIGADPDVKKLLWVSESFFNLDGKAFHELGLYFEMGFDNDPSVYARNAQFAGAEGNPRLRYEWIPIERARTLRVFPAFVLDRIHALPKSPEHIVVRN